MIIIKGDKVNYSVGYLVVLLNAFNGEGFQAVETAKLALFQNNVQVLELFLGGLMRKPGDNCVVACILAR